MCTVVVETLFWLQSAEFLAALEEFESLVAGPPECKDAAVFNRLLRAPVRSSVECGVVIMSLSKAFRRDSRNRLSAGPSAVRSMCALMERGLVNDDFTIRWYTTLMTLAIHSHGLGAATCGDENTAAMVASRGAELLMVAIDKLIYYEDMCLTVLEGLRKIVSCPVFVLDMLSAGLLKRLRTAMALHVHSVGIQQEACQFVMSACILADFVRRAPAASEASREILGFRARVDIREAALLSGILCRVYAAMDAHISDAKLQERACGALAGLGADRDEAGPGPNKLRILTSGGPSRVYNAMSAHLESETVQLAACAVIACLSGGAEEQDELLAASGCWDPLYNAMERHPKSQQLQEVCVASLANLVTSASSKRAMQASRAPALIRCALKAHPSSAKIQQFGKLLVKVLSGR